MRPDTPADGIEIARLFEDAPFNQNEMMEQLKRTAAGFGLPIGHQTRIYNTRLAQELGLWADAKQKGRVFHTAVFKAYFVNGDNLADKSMLLKLVASVGLPVEEASEVLEERRYQEKVDADWRLSWELGIKAVPTFILNNHRLVGAQSYEKLQNLLEINQVPRHG